MDQFPFYPEHPSQQPSFSLYGLRTPAQNGPGDDIQGSFDPLNFQPPFDPTHFNPAAQPPFGQAPQSPPDSYTKQSASSGEQLGRSHYLGSIDARDGLVADPGLTRSSSEEKEKEGSDTPAQWKRKAQNRAAQRAFRERKERHVHDLEEKVTNLQKESSTLVADNERLKRELARYSTENEILRATTNTSSPVGGEHGGGGHRGPDPIQPGPLTYSPTDFYSDLVPEGQSARLHRVMYCKDTGERLLDAMATWDMIQGHELFKKGRVDVAGLTGRLKGMALCDGQGPAFRESQARKALEESTWEEDDGLL